MSENRFFKSFVLSKQQSKIYFKLTLIEKCDNQRIFTFEMLEPVNSECLFLVKLQVRCQLYTFLTFNQIRLVITCNQQNAREKGKCNVLKCL